MNRRARTLRASLFGITLLVLAGLLTHGTFAGSGDEPHYLAIAHSLAFDFDLDLSNNYGAAEPLIGGGELRPEFHVRASRGGVRPVHDVGMPLLFAPYVRVMKPLAGWMAPRIPASVMVRLRTTPSLLYRNLIAVAMMVLASVLAARMFDAFLVVGLAPKTAFWTALLVALSPPLLVFGILFFTELLTALLCFVVFRYVAIDEETEPPSRWVFAGAVTGLLLLVHVRNMGLMLGLTAVAVIRLARRGAVRELAGFMAGVVALVAIRTLINHHLWGTWLSTPHAHPGQWAGWSIELATAGQRLVGMLFDQEYGLLPYAPVFVLAPFGLLVLARTHPRLAAKIGLVAGLYWLTVLLPVTNVYTWTGGWSPAARFLVPIVPLLAIGIAAAVRATPKLILIPLLVLQIVIDAYAWQHPKILWNDGDGVAAICARTGSRLCGILPSFVTPK